MVEAVTPWSVVEAEAPAEDTKVRRGLKPGSRAKGHLHEGAHVLTMCVCRRRAPSLRPSLPTTPTRRPTRPLRTLPSQRTLLRRRRTTMRRKKTKRRRRRMTRRRLSTPRRLLRRVSCFAPGSLGRPLAPCIMAIMLCTRHGAREIGYMWPLDGKADDEQSARTRLSAPRPSTTTTTVLSVCRSKSLRERSPRTALRSVRLLNPPSPLMIPLDTMRHPACMGIAGL